MEQANWAWRYGQATRWAIAATVCEGLDLLLHWVVPLDVMMTSSLVPTLLLVSRLLGLALGILAVRKGWRERSFLAVGLGLVVSVVAGGLVLAWLVILLAVGAAGVGMLLA